MISSKGIRGFVACNCCYSRCNPQTNMQTSALIRGNPAQLPAPSGPSCNVIRSPGMSDRLDIFVQLFPKA